MPFPSPPWNLHAQMWVTLFAVTKPVRLDRPGGLYAAAFASYGEGSPLHYNELLVARWTGLSTGPKLRITDIWVDDEESRDGGRSLWALPKEMAHLPVTSTQRSKLVEHTQAAATTSAGRIASAGFHATPSLAVLRTPLFAQTRQPRENGTRAVASMRGSARTLPCMGWWEFAELGPLAYLRSARQLGSFRLRDVRLKFG